jgi:hypothetical protein
MLVASGKENIQVFFNKISPLLNIGDMRSKWNPSTPQKYFFTKNFIQPEFDMQFY